MTRRPVFVGESNPYGERHFAALLDLPAGSAGANLRTRICGLTTSHYRATSRYDLCRVRWNMAEARAAAWRIARFHPDDVLVLLGRKVSDAFTPGIETFTVGYGDPDGGDGLYYGGPAAGMPIVRVHLPHPSGRCREWHAPGAFLRARALLRAACPDPPWGEIDTVGDER